MMKKSTKALLLCVLIFALGAMFQFLVLELSYHGHDEWGGVEPINFAVGYLTVLSLTVFGLFLTRRPWAALTISALITTMISVANYYILETRGSPFSFMQLQNFFTAMNVVSSYRFELTDEVRMMLAVGAELLLIGILMRKMRIGRRPGGVLALVMLTVMFYSYGNLIPRNVVGWSWDKAVERYGYTPCLVKCTLQSAVSVVKPDTYNESALREYINSYTESDSDSTPDIIFILNESWYDLEQVAEVDADKDVFSYIRSLDNSLYGDCVVPCAGGGTNVSEYEYLTGNSIYLSPNSNPFNTIDIMGGNSFATHLESLGYESLATHTESGANYARDVAFPALGFDTVHFREDYAKPEYYGSRYYYPTDQWAYRHLIEWYEEMSEAPRVMYLLTVQNHGGYEFLSEGEYLVHTQKDFGEYTNQINEYLSSISLTDTGFRTLVEYFENVERDVIICMVGDHAPIFALDLAAEADDTKIPLRSVPYVIWSNHIDLTAREAVERISLHCMPSYVMDVAGVKLSPYLDAINELRKDVPVLTSYGVCEDAEGNSFTIGTENQYKERIDRYLGLAYANMKKMDFMMDPK